MIRWLLFPVLRGLARRVERLASNIEQEHAGTWPPGSVGAEWLRLAKNLRTLAGDFRAAARTR